MNEHRKEKHEEIELKIEEEEIEQRGRKMKGQNSPHHKIKESQKNERKEVKTRRNKGNRKGKKAKLKADLRMEVKLQEKEEKERKDKEEDSIRRGIAKQGKKGKEKELKKGGIEKSKVKEVQHGIESVKEGIIEKGKQKVENKMEEEISLLKNRGVEEKETEIVLEKETSSREIEDRKEKLEVAKNLLLGAIVMEQILGLYLQNSQDMTCNREVGMWSEEISGDTAWDITGGYGLEENYDAAWDTEGGYCLGVSQDNDWDNQLETQASDEESAWLW